jgi:hypothetical protein
MTRFFHIWDIYNGPAGPYPKVRCVIYIFIHFANPKQCMELSNHLQEVSLALWTPATNVAIDEAMVAFLGRAKETLQILNKPISEGFKLWVVAQRGYFLQWVFHMPGVNGGPVGVPKMEPLNPTQSVVPFLMKKLPNWEEGRYHVFMDNLFTSTPLLEYLHRCRIGASGTAKEGAGLHQDIVTLNRSEKGKDNRAHAWGYSVARVVSRGHVSQIGWKDNSLVKHMSNIIDCEKETQSQRHRPGPRMKKARSARRAFGNSHVKMMPVPLVNREYQYNMGYVDQGDQLRSNAVTGRREQKNWKALFNGLFGIAIVNAYLLSHHSPEGYGYYTFTSFRRKLYKQLWKDPGKPNWVATESLLGKRKRVTIGEHVWVYRKQARCAFCGLKAGRALVELSANQGAQKRPKGGCEVCQVNLCKSGECFARWHDEKRYE